ncbi:EXS domain-containing protein [Plasmodiophora brassicae]|uniref:Uncharacterized protein n=1 Tax=Plasmodiophora brassicae TaxID=37360 RepID=A0A3P3YIC5_PLABS|nr:unnamed protein product [Plasmodiophora brassicae]
MLLRPRLSIEVAVLVAATAVSTVGLWQFARVVLAHDDVPARRLRYGFDGAWRYAMCLSMPSIMLLNNRLHKSMPGLPASVNILLALPRLLAALGMLYRVADFVAFVQWTESSGVVAWAPAAFTWLSAIAVGAACVAAVEAVNTALAVIDKRRPDVAILDLDDKRAMYEPLVNVDANVA